MIQCADCVAYRHLLKDILRGDAKDAQFSAMRGLTDEQVSPLGKIMHKIVKAAVQFRLAPIEDSVLEFELLKAVDELLKNPGATVEGWKTSKE